MLLVAVRCSFVVVIVTCALTKDVAPVRSVNLAKTLY